MSPSADNTDDNWSSYGLSISTALVYNSMATTFTTLTTKTTTTNNNVYKILVAILAVIELECLIMFIILCKYKEQIAEYCAQKKKTTSNQLPYINHNIYKPCESYEMETISNNSNYLEPMQIFHPTVEIVSSS